MTGIGSCRISTKFVCSINKYLLIPVILLLLIHSFSNHDAKAENNAEKLKWLVEPEFESAADFTEGFALIKKNGKYGYINREGIIIIEPRFDIAHPFKDGMAKVFEKNKGWGFINTSGKVLINNLSYTADFSEGLATVCTDLQWTGFNNRYSMVDKNGELVIPAEVVSITGF
jgi:hypothetical protein